MSKRCMVDGKFDAEVLGVEHDGVLVRELGTQRVDWYQANRVTQWSTWEKVRTTVPMGILALSLVASACSSVDNWTGEHRRRSPDLPLAATGSVPEHGECLTDRDCSRTPICDSWHLQCSQDDDGVRRCVRPVDACEVYRGVY